MKSILTHEEVMNMAAALVYLIGENSSKNEGVVIRGLRAASKALSICPRCGEGLKNGKALRNTLRWREGDEADVSRIPPGVTISRTGPPVMVGVHKCGSCGYSRTKDNLDPDTGEDHAQLIGDVDDRKLTKRIKELEGK